MSGSQSFLNAISQVRRTPPVPFDLRTTAAGVELTGYAVQWGARDDQGTYLWSAAWKGSDEVDLICHHDSSSLAGSCHVEGDDEGLYVTAVIPSGDDSLIASLKAHHFGAFSADVVVPPGAVRYASGRPFEATDWKLAAVSLVDARPHVMRAGAARGPLMLRSKADLVDVLRTAGVARAAADRIAAGGWDALSTAILPNAPSIASAIDALALKIKGN